jgi:hypothetical protein
MHPSQEPPASMEPQQGTGPHQRCGGIDAAPHPQGLPAKVG